MGMQHFFQVLIILTTILCGSTALAGEVKPLAIELPEPFDGGTPVPHFSPNFEPYDYRDRPPFLAPEGTTIISTGKTVTASAKPTAGSLERITDGDKAYGFSHMVEFPEGLQWVQVDLGAAQELYAVLLWHAHEGRQVYFDVIGQVSNDPAFKQDVTTIYNNDYDDSAGMGVGEDKEYEDSHQGRLIDTKGVKARYIRFYSQGSTKGEFNDYTEIEVWGK